MENTFLQAFDNFFIKKKYRLEIHGCAHFDNLFYNNEFCVLLCVKAK